MANTINSEVLKAWRQKRGWTQKQLADRLKCSSDQVSRWERGKSQNVRSHLRKALTKTFGVEWEELTKFPKESGKTTDNIFNVQLNVRVRHWERTALQLVSDYYRIPIANIVGLSPLLFLIVAEKSLAHRRAAVSEITSMQDKAETEGIRIAPHLKSDLGASHIVADSVIYSEKTSIEKRDLFGDLVELEWVSDPDGEGLNPFANYLKRLSEEIPDGMATELSADWGSDHIYYSLLEEVLREKFGLIADEGSDVSSCFCASP